MINFIVWLSVGAIIGWLASALMGRRREGLLLNISVGVLGALVARLVLTPLFGISTINQGDFSLPALLLSLLGAMLLMAAGRLVNFEGRGTVRRG